MKPLIFLVLLIVPALVSAQGAAPDLAGSWQVDTPEGPQIIVVGDSTVTFGDEAVNLRIQADTVFVQFGDEWVGYKFELTGEVLTLSGGDLLDPVVLTRVRRQAHGRFQERSFRNRR